jgi:hypothetical protein
VRALDLPAAFSSRLSSAWNRPAATAFSCKAGVIVIFWPSDLLITTNLLTSCADISSICFLAAAVVHQIDWSLFGLIGGYVAAAGYIAAASKSNRNQTGRKQGGGGGGGDGAGGTAMVAALLEAHRGPTFQLEDEEVQDLAAAVAAPHAPLAHAALTRAHSALSAVDHSDSSAAAASGKVPISSRSE